MSKPLDGWPERIDLIIPGDPASKGRPLVYHGHGITPAKTRQAENRVYSEFRSRFPDFKPYPGPVIILLNFWMATRQGRDWDNLAKLTTDALNGVAWVDDRQIVRSRVDKRLPDLWVVGKRGIRKRKTGDPLTWKGHHYEPHTDLVIRFDQEYKPTYANPAETRKDTTNEQQHRNR